jgi:hypothetical protein
MSGDGRNPLMPHTLAGPRMLPPVSEPVASGTRSALSATAAPPGDPAPRIVRIERAPVDRILGPATTTTGAGTGGQDLCFDLTIRGLHARRLP